jgi:integrase
VSSHAGQWTEKSHLINNMLRKFKTMCKKAGVRQYEIHDLRPSCITNWARNGAAMHVVRELAGHADLATTQEYYLSVQRAELDAASRLQEQVVAGISGVTLTDPKVTQAGQKRDFAKRKELTPIRKY